jgi:hypothetical protein
MVQHHLKDPHLDPTNLRAPSDINPDVTTPELQKEVILESLPEESMVWKPGESGATDPNSEAPKTGEQHPSQPSPVIPEVTDPDIPPPMVDPEPLEQDQVCHKFTRTLPKVDDPAALRLEARVQFSKNRQELTNKLLEKDSSNPVSTKGERGESAAQTGCPWSRDTPPKKPFQPKNSTLKFEI